MVAGVSKSKGCQTQARGSSETAAAEQGMTDMAELKSYLLFMQICGATGCSRFLTEGTTESRAVWVHVWAATGTRSASSPPRDRFGMVWRAPGGRILPESQSLFFPEHQLKSKKTQVRLRLQMWWTPWSISVLDS